MGIKASVSGIRGIVGESLHPPLLVHYTSAYARWLGRGRVAIGRDTRSSGPAIQRLVESVLLACGIDVIDLGIVPTPTLLLFVRQKELDGGILITASHNPIAWNALKLVKRGGRFLNEEDFAAFTQCLQNVCGAQETQAPDGLYKPAGLLGGITSDETALTLHADIFARAFPLLTLRRRKFRVAADPGNGAGARMNSLFLARLGCHAFHVHDDITGNFARPPEPRPEALAALSRLVTQEHCAVGFAQDPDADRLCLVDETGRALSEEMTLALSAWSYYLPRGRKNHAGQKKEGEPEHGKSDIVVNVSTSRYAADVARHYGRKCHLSKVGEANVLAVMTEKKAEFGGEGNGGVIYPLLNPCRDSFVGMFLILELIAAMRMPLSEIVARFHKEIAPPYTMLKDTCVFTGAMSGAYARIREECGRRGGAYTENTLDGLRLDFADGWVHLRESNTEPVVRIIAEANASARAKELVSMVKAVLREG